MKNILSGLGVASLLTLGSAGFAQADPMSMMQGYSACNTQYSACLASSDYSLATSPAEGMSKVQMNAMHARECASALQACYGSVQ